MSNLSLRERVTSGARAQVVTNVVRVAVQLGTVSILASTWGLELYGEWLIMAAIPAYLSFTDLGLFAAAQYDMIMAVGRGDRRLALGVFQSVSRGVTVVFAALILVLPVIAALVPIAAVLNLSTITELEAGWIVVALGLNAVLIAYAALLYGGFACEGRYGQGVMILAAITLVEFAGLGAAVLLGYGPAVAATAMLSGRLLGTAWMFVAMRRRVPWLHLGKPEGDPQVLKRLTSPALASAGLPAALALNVQGTVILVGLAAGPASVAVFATLRTMSRVVIQLTGSVSAVLAPEFARAYGESDAGLLRRIHRRGCQLALWIALPLLAFLAAFGGTLVDVWTQGTVESTGALLYLLLAAAGIDTLWYTSLAVLFSTNRHQRVTAIWVAACALNLPITYLCLEAWGLDGAAGSLVLLELFMLFVVLRRSIPAAHDTYAGWIGALVHPPPLSRTALNILRPRTPG